MSPADNGHHTGQGPKPTPPVYTHGHTSITAQSGGGVVVGTKTVRPGQKVTIGSGTSRTVVALQTEGRHTKLVIGGSTYHAVPQHPGATPAPHISAGVVTTNGHTITAIRSGKSIIVAEGSSTTTLRAGGKATFGGQTFSAPHHGGSIVVNGNGVPLTAAGSSQAVVTAGGHRFTAIDVGKSVIVKDGSSTLVVKDGSQTTFEGQKVSVVPDGGAIVINGKTTSLSALGSDKATASITVTAGGHTITALDKSGSVVLKEASSTVTVKDGKVATFQGQKVSILPNGSAVIINGATTSFSTKATTTDVGSYITKGLSGGSSPSPSPSITVANGAEPFSRPSHAMCVLCAAVLGFMGMVAIL